MRLGIFFDKRGREVRDTPVEESGYWLFDEDDYLLYALLCDPVSCSELLGEDPPNYSYGGMFIVRDYQYPLFRADGTYMGFPCGRKLGKTESIKWRAVSHAFRRVKESMLVTAPELVHLFPLTDAIEAIINSVRLTREFLDTRNQRTGFTHRPFGVDFIDGTKIVGRIPRLTGIGVKGVHVADLLIDEAQDYPEAGWANVHETVDKAHVDREGTSDFSYHFFGVHSGARDSGFFRRAEGGAFKTVQVTAIQRPGWNATEKAAAKASYGGSSSPDYRRNILGEAGGASSPYFSTARLFMCVDQDRESFYNTTEVMVGSDPYQLIRGEDFAADGLPIGEVLDLPAGYKKVWGGVDIGLTLAPTVIMLFSEEKIHGKVRLKLFRRIHLERFRTRDIREALYAITHRYGMRLKGMGLDITGLGFPIWQEMEDDENTPPRLLEITTGYFFNAKVPVGVEPENVTSDQGGRMRDQLGNTVVEETDPLTGQKRYAIYMPMVEAATRYVRELVDDTTLMLPFDPEITGDMQGETQQRVRRLVGLKNKPNAFHILDSMRAMAMKYREADVQAQMTFPERQPVFDFALE